MKGYEITFFTRQDRMHGSEPLSQRLLDEAKRLNIRGAAVSGALQGLGHDGSLHAVNMFDFSDQPIQIRIVVSESEMARLSKRLAEERVHLFYNKVSAEFGLFGADGAKLLSEPSP